MAVNGHGKNPLQDSLDNDVFGEGRGGLDVLQELKEKVDKEVSCMHTLKRERVPAHGHLC